MNDPTELTVSCPRCRTKVPWRGNPHRPFCSEKCRLIDLGLWDSGEYRIAGEAVDPDEALVRRSEGEERE